MHHSYIDQYSYQDSFIHKIDPRIKIVVVFFYTLALVSISKYKLFELIPFFALPILLIPWGKTPWRFVFRHLLVVSPFILMVALFNPLYDTTPVKIGNHSISRGWISALNIYLKFTMSMIMLLSLVSTTPFPQILCALQKMGMPQILILQLSFLYRYLFITIEESEKMNRARIARSYAQPFSWKMVFTSGGSMLGALFFRCLGRAERVYFAMKARGMKGEIRLVMSLKTGHFDWIYLLISLGYIFIFYVSAH